MCSYDFVGLYSTYRALYMSCLNYNTVFFFSFLGRRRRWASHIIDRSKLGRFPVTISDFFSLAYGCLSIYPPRVWDQGQVHLPRKRVMHTEPFFRRSWDPVMRTAYKFHHASVSVRCVPFFRCGPELALVPVIRGSTNNILPQWLRNWLV